VPSSACGFRPASDRSLQIRLGDSIDLDTHHRVLKLLRLLESEPLPGVINVHPAYASVLVVFDPLRWRHDDLEPVLREYAARSEALQLPPPRQIDIPVAYGGAFGPDLPDVARLNGLSAEAVIELHSSAVYTVYFLGFAPGFGYLGSLPRVIATPRLDVPRRRVPAGSVGIAGEQTGVYPFATPGGWRLIGRTPRRMFDAGKGSVLRIGDEVRFHPISAADFEAYSE
jgi:KipI family sensor histidine kinase inhibitor